MIAAGQNPLFHALGQGKVIGQLEGGKALQLRLRHDRDIVIEHPDHRPQLRVEPPGGDHHVEAGKCLGYAEIGAPMGQADQAAGRDGLDIDGEHCGPSFPGFDQRHRGAATTEGRG